MKRRELCLALVALPALAQASNALSPVLQAQLRVYAGDAAVQFGGLQIGIEPLVDNGNSVPISLAVTQALPANTRVLGMAVFNEKNPQPEVAEFEFSALQARAEVATRIRLAVSQQLLAVARLSNGQILASAVDVIVTIASCIEEPA